MKQMPPSSTVAIQNLKQVLKEQHLHLVKMLSILRQEHQALDQNNLLRFEEAVQQKLQQIKNLETIQPQLTSVEKILGGVLSKSIFMSFIDRMPAGKEKIEIISLWTNFQKTLNECNLQNKTNNRILSASTMNVKQALNILRGNTGNSTPDIYSKKGHQADHLQGQSIAVA
jgi:flagellar biosynthesis/type III secretory pathway chaperone